MFRTMMKAKIHKATVTECNLKYLGSVTIDENILDTLHILPNEKVQIVNNNNGARLETYVIPGKRKSRTICLNGAAARLTQPGDEIIIISYVLMDDATARNHQPIVAIMDEQNEIKILISEKECLEHRML